MNSPIITSYELELLPSGVYIFITDSGIRYIAPFFTASEFFPNRPFADQVLLFGIKPVDEEAALPSGVDPRIGPTVDKILRKNFDENPALIILYVCAT
jgi:hypothetical protein